METLAFKVRALRGLSFISLWGVGKIICRLFQILRTPLPDWKKYLTPLKFEKEIFVIINVLVFFCLLTSTRINSSLGYSSRVVVTCLTLFTVDTSSVMLAVHTYTTTFILVIQIKALFVSINWCIISTLRGMLMTVTGWNKIGIILLFSSCII